ncbi:hypothetical protein IGI04_001363 [Brassica rapa subsp. trilocularis]|uniref:Uncharacterized protein n=1 Tax=Brassica rapa subsp. trilocularis TaxID=1813537 RepID=A0ABQ7NUI9_BRACM|nr:hypothetical protein IGI04_001363 [Brassica rapa subsp. trilocularis]
METETQLVVDRIALNEKKVAMALDDLIKLSKRNAKGNKGRSSRRPKNKNRNFNGAARYGNPSKEKHYVNSLSGVRQGAVEKRRSNFKGNQFPVATNVARKAANVPPPSVRRRAFNAGRTTSANQSSGFMQLFFHSYQSPRCYVSSSSCILKNIDLARWGCHTELGDVISRWVDLEIPQELALFLRSYFEMGVVLMSGEPLRLGNHFYLLVPLASYRLLLQAVVLLAPPVQSKSRFTTKRHEMDQKVENGGGKWKTLDSRFAIMKEQRKNSTCNSGVGLQVPRLPPWARARRF